VHIAFDYSTRKVYVVNSALAARSGLTATATLYDVPSLTQEGPTQSVGVTAPANASTQVLTVPAPASLSPTYFIRLQLKDSTGALVSNNVYWYSTSPDVMAGHATWYKTTVRSYANLAGLNSLATNTSLSAAATRTISAGQETVKITLSNGSATNVAFFVRPELTAGNGGNEVVPISYTDNYVSLWPGESTTITATYQTSDLGGKSPFLRVRGYNIPTTSIAVP